VYSSRNERVAEWNAMQLAEAEKATPLAASA